MFNAKKARRERIKNFIGMAVSAALFDAIVIAIIVFG